ncbi:MAG: SOS response-associated peptidase [Butyrivibrio sp.]|nr:SOS response-associated peptidase [Butyrivibrio sp.]
MCGRYVCYSQTEDDVEEELGLARGSLEMAAGDVCPTDLAVVLTNGLKINTMPWGLKEKSLIINARAETALEKPTFGDSILRRRCIMPAGAFYEWDKDKNKVTFFRQDESPIYLAGFYQLSDNKDSFVILTTAANESMIKVHDRMPLMIEKDAVRDWLGDTDAAKEMLKAEMPQLKSHREYEQLSLF